MNGHTFVAVIDTFGACAMAVAKRSKGIWHRNYSLSFFDDLQISGYATYAHGEIVAACWWGPYNSEQTNQFVL